MSEQSGTDVYQYTTVDYPHPEPALRPRGSVSVHINLAGHELVAGASVEVGR